MPIFNSTDSDQVAGYANQRNQNDPNASLDPQNQQANPQQMQQQMAAMQYATADDALSYAQQAKEEAIFEIKKIFTDAFTAKAQELMDVDPATATSLRAAAAAANEAISTVTPLGQDGQFNAQQQQQQQQQNLQGMQQPQQQSQQQLPQDPTADVQQTPQKLAEDELGKFIAAVSVEKIASTGYFELNKFASDEELEKDLTDTIVVIRAGVEKFAADNDLDFNDSNSWDLLKDLINDGTMFYIGAQELSLN